jgi:hypothetical protein
MIASINVRVGLMGVQRKGQLLTIKKWKWMFTSRGIASMN